MKASKSMLNNEIRNSIGIIFTKFKDLEEDTFGHTTNIGYRIPYLSARIKEAKEEMEYLEELVEELKKIENEPWRGNRE